jgi:hypothetical protein
MGTIDGHPDRARPSGGLVGAYRRGGARAETGFGFTMAPLVNEQVIISDRSAVSSASAGF